MDVQVFKALNAINGFPIVPGTTPTVRAGWVLNYSITVTNIGTNTGSITLSDPVPDGTRFVGAPGEDWSCPANSGAGTDCTQPVEVLLFPFVPTVVEYTVQVLSPVPEGVTHIDNKVTPSSGTCIACTTSNPVAAAPAVAAHLYWGNVGGTIMESNLDGSGAVPIVFGQSEPSRVTVAGSHIYWTNEGSGSIMRANLDGSAVTGLVSGQPEPSALTVDASASHIYWGDEGNGEIMRATLNSSGTVTAVDTLVTGQNRPDGVAVNATNIFWGNEVAGGAIMEAPLAGGTPTVLVPGQNRPEGLVVTASNIYWGNEVLTNGTVMRANLNGSDPTAVISGQNGPSGLAVTSSNIYWTNRYAGTVNRAALNGTSPATLVSGQNRPEGVALSGQ